MSASPASARRPRIALLPLDDRPVNVRLPADVAAVAGVALDVPPASILPSYRTAGDADALGAWLRERAQDPDTVHLVVSIDMLVHGGLIASRTSHDSTRTVLARLDVLREIRRSRPDLPISAVSLVTRASNSYSAAEEPEYWTAHGKELHALGGDAHRLLDANDVLPLEELTPVPAHVVSDYSLRRVRNHIVNLSALTLAEDGTVGFLAITADDTAPFAAGSAEQVWLRHWMRMLPSGRGVLMYPGADEVGAVLVARALATLAGARASFSVACADPEGLDRVPPYENMSLAASVSRQIRAAGADEVPDGADVTLVLHAPDPDRHDMFRGRPEAIDEDAVAGTVALVRERVARGERVALADVRYPNGADEALVRALSEAGLLDALEAFGGWNTAGNTLGSVIAVAAAAVIGRRSGGFDPAAARVALLTRLLDDFAYQSVVRVDAGPRLFPDHYPMADDARVAEAERVVHEELTRILDADLPAGGVRIAALTLPWRRSFEVGLVLE
ncbi:DUF4127 family protein [Microbacterium resistens]|uniref:DUF4127 family protein n=1 Tax=Microbacterium resistens TaxID=156977 RepID=A0ABY3RSF9_9MICO|nr:DUF4127 family protein [Microbacterium resistens]UGS25432.1 DUF4127 family protein [Microbacterium resistens]